jgi:putative redox protein
MGERITVKSLDGGMRVEATNGSVKTVMDLPKDLGGEGTALGATETLLAALGGCTAMTLLLYARRKSWPLEGVDADFSIERPKPGTGSTPERIRGTLRFRGALDDAQRQRLLEVAGKCPVNRTLSGPVLVEETLE